VREGRERERTRVENTREREREKRMRERGHACINQPFIVLTETKFSYSYIPVWARYSPREHARERERMSKRGTEKKEERENGAGTTTAAVGASSQQRQQWGLRGRGLDRRRDTAGPARIDAVDVPARLWSAVGRRWRAPTIAGTVRRRGGWRRAVGCGSSRQDFPPLAPAYGCVSRRWLHFFFRVLEPSAPTTLTSWGRLLVRTPTTVVSHDSRTPVSGGRSSSGSAVDGRGETPSPLPSRGGVRMDANDRRWRRGRAVEFAYNLSRHSTTGLAPFQSLYGEGRHPARESYIPGTSRPSQAGARLQ